MIDAALAPGRTVRSSQSDRIAGALWGMHIADALAMPSHWFYGAQLQVSTFYNGPITGYVKPTMQLGESVMNKSDTGGAGRGAFGGDIIGSVINHGKKKYWAPDKQLHYHCTLEAGENTLEAHLTRLVYNGIAEKRGQLSVEELRSQYVDFMITPGNHNDCYASSCHRMFFANRERGRPLVNCPDNDEHNVDTLDGLCMAIPVALGPVELEEDRNSHVDECVDAVRKSDECKWYARLYVHMLRQVLRGLPLAKVLTDAVETVSSHLSKDDALWVKQMGWLRFGDETSKRRDPCNACYLGTGFPAMMHMVYKYGGDVRAAVLANANTGGENVHRGMLVGALVGAAHGASKIPEALKKGLYDSTAIAWEIDLFVAVVCGEPPPKGNRPKRVNSFISIPARPSELDKGSMKTHKKVSTKTVGETSIKQSSTCPPIPICFVKEGALIDETPDIPKEDCAPSPPLPTRHPILLMST